MRISGSVVDPPGRINIISFHNLSIKNQLTTSHIRHRPCSSCYLKNQLPSKCCKFKGPYSPFQVTTTPLSLLVSHSLASTSSMAVSESDSRVSVDENHTVEGNGPIDRSCTEIIVVRHGETDWNALGKMQGQLDVDMNEVGRQQAVAVAARLSREPNISAVYSSDLKRALETAEIIATRCGRLEVIRDQDMRERHLGNLQGLVYQDLAKLSPNAYEAFKSPRLDQEIPGGGESRDQLYKRCTSSLQRIGENHRGQKVVVVTHGGVIGSLYSRAAPNGPPARKISNTSVSVIHLSDADVWSVKSWNDVGHLRQTGFLKSGFGGDASSG